MKNSARAGSTVNPTLFIEDAEITVIQKCIVAELHLLQGFVNHIFWKGLVTFLGREKALLWPQKIDVAPKNYHGEAFEGKACRKLLKNSDKLLDREICRDVGGALPLLSFIAAFKAMDKIVNSSFSVVRVQSDSQQYIKDLKKALLAIDVSETLKIHIILDHICESLEYLNKEEGLGLWSEQAVESIHRDFITFWNRQKINNMQDSKYILRLKAAVIEFPSKHI